MDCCLQHTAVLRKHANIIKKNRRTNFRIVTVKIRLDTSQHCLRCSQTIMLIYPMQLSDPIQVIYEEYLIFMTSFGRKTGWGSNEFVLFPSCIISIKKFLTWIRRGEKNWIISWPFPHERQENHSRNLNNMVVFVF